jgi:hypothetical protein
VPERLGLGPLDGAAVDAPDGGRVGERGGAPGQQAGGAGGEQVDLGDAVGARPGERGAERTAGLVLGEDPGAVALPQGGAAGERARLALARTEVVADERAELDAQQR